MFEKKNIIFIFVSSIIVGKLRYLHLDVDTRALCNLIRKQTEKKQMNKKKNYEENVRCVGVILLKLFSEKRANCNNLFTGKRSLMQMKHFVE